MADQKGRATDVAISVGGQNGGAGVANRFLGSLKDALNAAGRDEGSVGSAGEKKAGVLVTPPPLPETVLLSAPGTTPDRALAQAAALAPPDKRDERRLSASEAAFEARGGAADSHGSIDAPPTTRVVRGSAKSGATPGSPARTTLVRGRQPVQRGAFRQDPVVGWLVVIGGPGIGAFRPIYEGNNTIGRGSDQRIPIDFGDEAISSQEQAFIRYDSAERTFLFVPNLAKTNIVSVNDKRPTAAVALQHMDIITLGRTQVVFVPFCGADFDWGEIAQTKE